MRAGSASRAPASASFGAYGLHPSGLLARARSARAVRGREAPERSGAERSGAEPWPSASSIVGHNFSARRMYLTLILSVDFSLLACACGRCFITCLSIFDRVRRTTESTFFSIFAGI